MNKLNNILSYLMGGVFIFSALSKAISISGFATVVDAFSSLLGLGMLYGHGMVIGWSICLYEFLFGAMILHRSTRKAGICGISGMLIVFTGITYVNLTSLYGGIESCGCFGETIHFTAAGTFYKNIVLLITSCYLLYATVFRPWRTVGYLLCLVALSGCGDGKEFQRILTRQHTLAHYRLIDRDTQKYQAASFLLDNMKYHTSGAEVLSVPAELEQYRTKADSSYHALVQDATMDSMPWDSIRSLQAKWHAHIKEHPLPDATVARISQADADIIDADFLIAHIDNAFDVWQTSKYAQGLSFDDFKEYLLPYRSVKGYGFLQSGEEYRQLFGKYLDANSSRDLNDFVDTYNTHIGNLRDMGGKTTRQGTAGVYDLYTRDFHDCVDIASYGCNILRANGLPTAVEYNICYRSLAGRHYMVAVLHGGEWQVFNPESSLPIYTDEQFGKTVNLYRSTYAAQKNTPYFLRAEDEFVPEVLSDPCILDVSDRFHRTATISLPFAKQTTNRLAYLATYNYNQDGLIPVTWGRIEKGEATFEHAITGVVYFPIYYPDENSQTFGEPFHITMDGSTPTIHPLTIGGQTEERDSLLLTRKYPRKPNMIKVAEELVGGRFLGANKADFSDAVVLATIREAPLPKLQDIALERTGKYRYYRFQASEAHPHAHISMLEWLAPADYGYSNVLPPTRPHITAPADTALLYGREFVKLLDEDSWEKMSWKAEYDGNMQTAPSPYPNITLWLKEPQVITHVRFAPKNADNGICAGNRYELYYWDGHWKYCSTQVAEFEYVAFADVPLHKLYWLRNLTTGKEEMPFVIDEQEKQVFIYQI